MHSKFAHHPHPLGSLVPNFVSFVAAIAELARGEKLSTQWITQSLTQLPSLFDAPGTDSFGTSELILVSRQLTCYSS